MPNFTPDQKPYKKIGAFKMWVQKVIPLVYDEALSQYELLCKIVEYLNNLIENNSIQEDNIGALLLAFQEIQTYVNTYFDNLDVQDEINAKIDEMAESGQLEQIVSHALEQFTRDLRAEVDLFENKVNSELNLQASNILRYQGLVQDKLDEYNNKIAEQDDTILEGSRKIADNEQLVKDQESEILALSNRISNIVANVTQSSEVIDARTMYDGENAGSLRNAITIQDSDIRNNVYGLNLVMPTKQKFFDGLQKGMIDPITWQVVEQPGSFTNPAEKHVWKSQTRRDDVRTVSTTHPTTREYDGAMLNDVVITWVGDKYVGSRNYAGQFLNPYYTIYEFDSKPVEGSVAKTSYVDRTNLTYTLLKGKWYIIECDHAPAPAPLTPITTVYNKTDYALGLDWSLPFVSEREQNNTITLRYNNTAKTIKSYDGEKTYTFNELVTLTNTKIVDLEDNNRYLYRLIRKASDLTWQNTNVINHENVITRVIASSSGITETSNEGVSHQEFDPVAQAVGDKLETYIIDFDGTDFKSYGQTLTFDEIREKCLDPKYFVYCQYSNRLYIPAYISASQIFFDATYITSNKPTMHRIGIDNEQRVTRQDYDLAKESDLEELRSEIDVENITTVVKNDVSQSIGSVIQTYVESISYDLLPRINDFDSDFPNWKMIQFNGCRLFVYNSEATATTNRSDGSQYYSASTQIDCPFYRDDVIAVDCKYLLTNYVFTNFTMTNNIITAYAYSNTSKSTASSGNIMVWAIVNE